MKKHRRTVFLALGCMALVGIVGFFVWFSWPAKPYHLNLVRQAIEQGKAGAYFRIVDGDRVRIAILSTELIVANTKTLLSLENNWGQSIAKQSLSSLSTLARKEFRVYVPTNAVWELRVTLQKDRPFHQRLKRMPNQFRMLCRSGVPDFQAALLAWDGLYVSGDTQIISSGPITNSVPHTQ